MGILQRSQMDHDQLTATKLALENKIQQLSTRLEQVEGGSASDKMRIAQVTTHPCDHSYPRLRSNLLSRILLLYSYISTAPVGRHNSVPRRRSAGNAGIESGGPRRD